MLLIVNLANMKDAKGGVGWIFDGGRTYPLSVFNIQWSKILVNSIQIQVRKSPIFIYISLLIFFFSINRQLQGLLVIEGSL
jgi:hypothetical protein